jgi:hypothetical protein
MQIQEYCKVTRNKFSPLKRRWMKGYFKVAKQPKITSNTFCLNMKQGNTIGAKLEFLERIIPC